MTSRTTSGPRSRTARRYSLPALGLAVGLAAACSGGAQVSASTAPCPPAPANGAATASVAPGSPSGPPTAEEAARCRRFLREQAALLEGPARLTPFPPGPDAVLAPAADPARRAQEALIHVLFNHNGFLPRR